MKWILTGDTHGRVPERLATIKEQIVDFEPNETAVIILGDAGLNYWGNISIRIYKRYLLK